jgi:hypothetical protein
MRALSPEQRHSATPLESLFREMSPLDFVGAPLGEAINDGEATAQLLDGIDLSSWDPTPSIHSRNDRPTPTFDNAFGLWYNGSESVERDEGGDNTLYREFDGVQASRVREDELQYGWELLERFNQISTWMGPVQLGRRMKNLVNIYFFSLCSCTQ